MWLRLTGQVDAQLSRSDQGVVPSITPPPRSGFQSVPLGCLTGGRSCARSLPGRDKLPTFSSCQLEIPGEIQFLGVHCFNCLIGKGKGLASLDNIFIPARMVTVVQAPGNHR